jgi:hypothetical protein
MVNLCMQSKPKEEVCDLISELITGPEAGPAFSETCPVFLSCSPRILSLSIMVRSDFNFRKIFFYPFEGTKGEESEP